MGCFVSMAGSTCGALLKNNQKPVLSLTSWLGWLYAPGLALTHGRKNNLHCMFRKDHKDRIYLPWLVVVLLSVDIIQRALMVSPQSEQLWPWSACSVRIFTDKWTPSRFQLQFFSFVHCLMYDWLDSIFFNLASSKFLSLQLKRNKLHEKTSL